MLLQKQNCGISAIAVGRGGWEMNGKREGVRGLTPVSVPGCRTLELYQRVSKPEGASLGSDQRMSRFGISEN